MKIFHLDTQEPGHRKRLIGWGIVYLALAAAAIFFTYIIGQTLVSRTIPAGNIKLSVSKQHYKMGEVVHFTITNNFTTNVYVNNTCPQEPLTVYKWDGKKWGRIHKSIIKSLCTGQNRQIIVKSHSSADGSYALWKDLFKDPGIYRLVAVVNNYNGLPFADFEVMKSLPAGNDDTIINGGTGSSGGSISVPSDSEAGENGVETDDAQAGQTYTIHVNSSGNYDVTALSINAGDSILFVYSAPRGDEVRTHFTPISPTTSLISSLTLDQERTSGTRTFAGAGKWTFRADDHSGNTGTIVVN